jgi:SAM-dependent methyltransferase
MREHAGGSLSEEEGFPTVSQFDFSAAEYSNQLDPLLATFGSESLEFAERKAQMILTAARRFGPTKHLDVLDVGCGPGTIDSFLLGSFRRLVCVDPSPDMLAAAQDRLPGADFRQLVEGQPLPFDDGEFHVVFFSCVLHHVPVPDWSRFLAECSRVVKPGGLVICIEHNPWNPLTRRIVAQCPFDEGVTLLSAPDVKRGLEAAGLAVEESFYHVFFPGRLDFLRPFEAYLRACPLGGQHTVVARKPSATDRPLDWSKISERSDVKRSLAIPFFNEVDGGEKVARALYEAMLASDPSFELVLVDNGSVDGTSEILRALAKELPQVRTLRVFPNRGYGWGVLHGLMAARGQAVGFMAGDGQIRPEDVVLTFRRFEVGDCDLAKVRRVTRGDGPLRNFISTCWNFLFSLGLGRYVTDGNGTPKIFRRHTLPDLRLVSRDWFVDSEMWMKGLTRGWRIAEVDVDFLARERGTSHVRFAALWEFAKNLVRWGLRYRRKKWKGEPL